MNPRERLLATLRRQPHDRVPLRLEGLHYPTREAIAKVDDPARRELAERIFDQTPEGVSCPSLVNRWLATPPQFLRTVDEQQTPEKIRTTKEIRTPKGPLTAITEVNRQTHTSWTIKYPVESLEDIEKIRSVPWELPKGLRPPNMSKLPTTFQPKCYTITQVSSPFVCVGGMMPFEYFLELCATHFRLIAELTAQCTERVLDVARVLLSEKTIEYFWMGGCEWLTPPMGSPKLYEALVQGPEKQIIARAHAAGAVCHVHCHGNVRSTLELAVQRGTDYFEPMEPPPDGDITMAEAKRIVRGRMVLGGNIEARILANESADVVEAATRAAFEGGKESMVLSDTAGPISKMTPRLAANYHRMIDVWEELSPI